MRTSPEATASPGRSRPRRTRGCRLPACAASPRVGGLRLQLAAGILSSVEDHAYLNAKGLLGTAVFELVGVGDIRERLYKAGMAIVPLQPRHLPDYLRGDYEALWRALTWLPVERPGEGTLQATLRSMDAAEADRIAKQLFELYDRVAEASYSAE